MFYREVFEALQKNRIKYMVAGGTAVVLHGYVRFTADLDLIILLEEKNIDTFYETLQELDYQPKLPLSKQQLKDPQIRNSWHTEKNMLVFSFIHKKDPLKIIDMFIEEPINFKKAYQDRKKIKVDGISISLLSSKDLQRMKKIAARPQDMIDIEQLKEIEKKKK